MPLPPNDHKKEPRLCFKPCRGLTAAKLASLIKEGAITATVRVGRRDAVHPKGYYVDQIASAFVCDRRGEDCVLYPIRIVHIHTKALRQLTPGDLRKTLVYTDWAQVQEDLSMFEGRNILPNADVTLVHFQLLSYGEKLDHQHTA